MQREQTDKPRPMAQNKRVAADKISAVAARVEGVERAYTVMTGTTAVVGIELEKRNAPRNEMVQMEDKVAKRVIEKVPVVRTVYVTAAPDAVARIRNIAEQVAQGQPIGRFNRDIRNITRDLRETTR